MYSLKYLTVNPLNAELNPICYFLVLLGAHHFLHVNRIRVNFSCELQSSYRRPKRLAITLKCVQ